MTQLSLKDSPSVIKDYGAVYTPTVIRICRDVYFATIVIPVRFIKTIIRLQEASLADKRLLR